MGRRYAAFLLAALGSGLELFGAMVGQGMLGQGLLFGLGGPGTVNLAVELGMLAAAVSLVAAVALMFAQDPRHIAWTIAIVAGLGTLAAGPVFALTAAVAVAGAVLAHRVDRRLPVI
jgi:hypothetical protein